MRALILPVILAAALVVAAAPAGAAIVPQKGIAGVELRMTKVQVRAKLGAPKRIVHGKNDFGRYTNFVYARVTVLFQSGSRVTAVRTKSPLERTAAGVGVGSSEAKVKSGVPGVKCATLSGARQCVIGVFKPGRVVTVFQIEKGHVGTVVIGIVVD